MDLDDLCARFVKAQLAGDRREALRLVLEEGVGRGAPTAELSLRVLEAAQREIGLLWQDNRISVADEHLATAIAQVVLTHLYRLSPASPLISKRVVFGCVEGEHHDFPARLAADALDLAGYDVRFLGADVPTESLVSMLHRERPDLVALSVTMSFNLRSLRMTVARLRSAFGDALPILVGGAACSTLADPAGDLGADAFARDARELIEVAGRLVAHVRPQALGGTP
ncbi:cobalamin B12-binding domain-containing protein [Polyangium sorediatum]|uniref:Cobalamin-dependent protein n=1 Tax=Polyangium sorediatum TaxID=889274 RepID=A0ABT6NJW6_9BACT|nr:cobalamin-dependent protein [Polyangium sorediatum]MDI1428540.1 cobalamin-dependent protein [Polyangium sorediatum]